MKPPFYTQVARKCRRPLLPTALLALAVLLPAPAAAQEWMTWEGVDPEPEALVSEEERAQALLESIPSDAAEGTPEAKLRAALLRRVALIEEFEGLLGRQDGLGEQVAEKEELEAERRSELEEIESLPPPEEPSAPTAEELQALEEEVARLRGEAEIVRDEVSAANRRVAEVQDKQTRARERRQEAAERAELLGNELEEAGDGPDADRLQLRIDNALLEVRIADETVDTLQAELDTDSSLAELRSLTLELAEARLERAELELELFRTAREEQLAVEQRQREEELAEAELEAEQADDPVERLLADRQTRIARVDKQIADLQPLKLSLGREVDEQERRLSADKEELQRLQDEVERGTSSRIGEKVRAAFQRLPKKRREISLVIRPGTQAALEDARERRFEIDEILYDLADAWKAELEEALTQVPEDRAAAARARSAELRSEYRRLVNTERADLTEVINRGSALENVRAQRSAVLSDLETFLKASVLWIRDGKPLDGELFATAGQELGQFWQHCQATFSPETWDALAAALGKPIHLLYAGLLFPVLPVGLWLLRRRMRAYRMRRVNGDGAAGLGRSTLLVLSTLVECVLFAVYLFLVATALPLLELPSHVEATVVNVLTQVALFVGLWSLNRALLTRGGLAVQLGWLPEDTVAALHRFARGMLLGFVLLGFPWAVLSEPPFLLAAIPRLLLTAYVVLAAFLHFQLFRVTSPLIRDLVGPSWSERLASWSVLWNGLILAGVFSVPVLDALGYRFAADSIARSLVLTLATMLLLPILYRAATSIAERLTRRAPPTETGVPGEEDEPRSKKKRKGFEVRDFLRLAFTFGGVLLLANYWGLDAQAWRALDELHFYRVDTGSEDVEWVSAADFLFALVVLVGTTWLLRHLPGIYDLTIFPRLDLDAGVRYAIVTISRYGLFFVGIVVALSAIQLDLNKLGWLVAAMGVGLGFGLQEIVSNFVSGLILLVERPIRVGDQVTVGSVVGEVKRINIRATTVLNFDKQEVIVPNRDLIAKEVTNWTLGDGMTRLLIPIGVAYGSDVDKVMELLLDAAKQHDEVLSDPPPRVFFMSHGESSLDFEVRVYLASPDLRLVVKDKLNRAINRALTEAGVEIPFPQRDLHIRSAEGIERALSGRDAPEEVAARS